MAPCWYSQLIYSNLLATSFFTETPDFVSGHCHNPLFPIPADLITAIIFFKSSVIICQYTGLVLLKVGPCEIWVKIFLQSHMIMQGGCFNVLMNAFKMRFSLFHNLLLSIDIRNLGEILTVMIFIDQANQSILIHLIIDFIHCNQWLISTDYYGWTHKPKKVRFLHSPINFMCIHVSTLFI